jgi:chromosome segregation ATPase
MKKISRKTEYPKFHRIFFVKRLESTYISNDAKIFVKTFNHSRGNSDLLVNELNENIINLEMEKASMENKLNSLEASLTRWIFRACDYKTDLQEAQAECFELKAEITNLKTNLTELNERLAEYKDYENTLATNKALNQDKANAQSELNRLNGVITTLKNDNEKLINQLKKSEQTSTVVLNKLEKDLQDANKQIQSCKDSTRVKDVLVAKLESENEDLKTFNADLKRKELDMKEKLDKNKMDCNELIELKKQVEQFKSETNYLLKKNDTLASENQQLKKKSDLHLLEKNSIKHKMDEIMVDYEKLLANTKCPTTVDLSIQTDDFNYDDIIKPLCLKFDKQIKDLKHNESDLKHNFDEMKTKFQSLEHDYDELNRKFTDEYKINCEMSDRNEFLYNKCEKLKEDLKLQGDQLHKNRLDFDIEKEILETTISQYKKFIDFITHADPELLKKLQLFVKK